MMEDTAEYQASIGVWQYCPPVLFAFGTFGNVMTIVILRHLNMKRSAMPVYLTALAVSDTCLLYTGLLRAWVMAVFDLDFRSQHAVICKLHTWLVYSLTILSSWILMFMTVERTLSVWRPHHVVLLCHRKKASVIVVGIVTFSGVLNCHFLFGLDVLVPSAEDHSSTNNSYNNGGADSTCYMRDPRYAYFVDSVWPWVDMTVSSLIPFTVLLIGNTLILWKVSLSVRTAKYLGSVRPGEVTQRKKTTSSMTVTLMALSVIFFFTTAPICVYNIVEPYAEIAMNSHFSGQGRLQLAWAVVNMLVYTNSTVNFYLYCLSGAKFRKEVVRRLCCFFRPASHWSVNNSHDNGHTVDHIHNCLLHHHHHYHYEHQHHGQHPHENGDVRRGGCCHNTHRNGTRSPIDSLSLSVHHRALRTMVNQGPETASHSTEF